MQSGNGIDGSAIYALLQEVAQRIAAYDRRFDEIAEVLNEHSRKIDDLRAEVTELRLSVNQYHGAVIGHGIDLTRLTERVKRIEAHLSLDPTAT
jgi:predicted  nucleic acid-binding Zn-ribbon protein